MKVPQISLSVVLFLLLFNLVIFLLAHSLQPLVGAVLARYFKGEVSKPAVFRLKGYVEERYLAVGYLCQITVAY